MRYLALACDYDGTIAASGILAAPTIEALGRLRASGRKLILVTGRELPDLMRVCPRLDLFDRVVAENGALLYRPAGREEKLLTEAPSERLIEALRRRDVRPLSIGHAIVSTWEPNETVVIQTIRDLGLELHVVFNKGAVMVLPSGVNKATGLTAALDELSLSPHNCVGVGDAENDHAFLALCEAAVVVDNALPALKERADLVTAEADGAGVAELVERLLASDLAELAPRLARHAILLGRRDGGEPVHVEPYGASILVAGASGSGKSTFAVGFIERLAEQGFQFCVIDPEGDYPTLGEAVTLGTADTPPTVAGVVEVLAQPRRNAIVNLVGLPLADRPGFFESLLPAPRGAAGPHRPSALDRGRRGASPAARGGSRSRAVAGRRAARAPHGDRASRAGRAGRPRGRGGRGGRRRRRRARRGRLLPGPWHRAPAHGGASAGRG